MKTPFAIVALLAVVTAVNSQTTTGTDAMESQITRNLHRPENRSLLYPQPGKPNEIKPNNITYSGIFVESVKTDNPLQLLNPAAPPEYGSAEDNVVHDPMSGKASGLKLFSIQF